MRCLRLSRLRVFVLFPGDFVARSLNRAFVRHHRLLCLRAPLLTLTLLRSWTSMTC